MIESGSDFQKNGRLTDSDRAHDQPPSKLPDLLLQIREKRIGAEALARFIAEVAPLCVHHRRYYSEFFQLWQEAGIHITPVHFYQPIPDTRDLPPKLWERPSKLSGIDMNEPAQLELLRVTFPQFRTECEKLPVETTNPSEFSLLNGLFGGIDALVAYCMVRHFKPNTIIEVGSGYSSLLLARACAENGNSSLTCIEPFPLDFLKKGFPGLRNLTQRRVQDVDREFFSQLRAGDILFIDSSHTVKAGGDVNYLFLEILPCLNPGVIVHVHDIFFPFEYPRSWIMEEHRFWSEQYLLQSFLAFNDTFEVVLCNSYLAATHREELKATFPHSPSWGGGSFWMRRKLTSE